ncbi:LOW QUALITY PROTEIN: hypothetical protein U9M48_043533 [Paspalum notatum var. saurae]|uniref:Uncharacterized protein n=1 Tax=Paspalum notatum var. saurae TaxID=547442 RepID=A0AAQ3XH75_PASNO
MQVTGRKTSFIFFFATTPMFSLASISLGSATPSGSFQSKWYRRLARASSMLATPRFMPAHMRRPDPNGMNSLDFSNRSGLNSSASSQYLGFLQIAQALMSTADLACLAALAWEQQRQRRVQPQSFLDDKLEAGLALVRSSSVIAVLPLKASRTSACTLAITAGFRASSVMHQLSEVDEVSLPAPNMS